MAIAGGNGERSDNDFRASLDGFSAGADYPNRKPRTVEQPVINTDSPEASNPNKIQQEIDTLDLNIIGIQQGKLSDEAKAKLIAGYEELKQSLLDRLERERLLSPRAH